MNIKRITTIIAITLSIFVVYIIIMKGGYHNLFSKTTFLKHSNTITSLTNGKELPTVSVDFVKVNTSQFISWPSIYKNTVVYSNNDINHPGKQDIYLLDLHDRSETKIYSLNEEDPCALIQDTKIGASHIYWVEERYKDSRHWKIMSYDQSNGSISVIRESNSEQGTTLTPRISNEEDSLVWLEGTMDKDKNVSHEIYLYRPNYGIQKIADVNYVTNPYDIIKIKNNHVAYIEKSDNNWSIKIIDLDNNSEKIVFLDKEPARPVSDGNILVWQEGEDSTLVLIKDIGHQSEKHIVDDSMFLFDIFDGNIIYTKSQEKHHLYKYYTNIDAIQCLTEKVEKERVYYELVSSYGDTTVCVYENLPEPEYLAIIKETY